MPWPRWAGGWRRRRPSGTWGPGHHPFPPPARRPPSRRRARALGGAGGGHRRPRVGRDRRPHRVRRLQLIRSRRTRPVRTSSVDGGLCGLRSVSAWPAEIVDAVAPTVRRRRSRTADQPLPEDSTRRASVRPADEPDAALEPHPRLPSRPDRRGRTAGAPAPRGGSALTAGRREPLRPAGEAARPPVAPGRMRPGGRRRERSHGVAAAKRDRRGQADLGSIGCCWPGW